LHQLSTLDKLYLNRLIGQGHRVAVCEQIEVRKRGGKSLLRREVVRLVMPSIVEDGA
jgi:DNA mismatch repair protein MutS